MRHFGFEFECASTIPHRQIADDLISRKIMVDPYATGETHCREGCYSGWQVKHDGSIALTEVYPYPVELVSPPITLASTKGMVRVLNYIRPIAKINASCGLHIHVSAPELTTIFNRNSIGARELVGAIWLSVEKVFLSYVPESRRNNEYCKSGIDWSHKYQAINFLPLSQPSRTVEFRLHSATLNPRKALAFAALCVGFVNNLVFALQNKLNGPVVTIEPNSFSPPPVKTIKTMKAELHLHKTPNNWIIEVPKGILKHTSETELPYTKLENAFDDLKKDLGLRGRDALSGFQFPSYGNAMNDLCKFLNITGPYGSYLQQRYDEMVSRFGYYGNEPQLLQDESDYSHEEEITLNDYMIEEGRL